MQSCMTLDDFLPGFAPQVIRIRHGLSGPIPPEVGNLAKLRRLRLYGNYLRGEIPRQLGKLTNLQLLDFLYSDLEGEIPRELGNLRNLDRRGWGTSGT